MRTKEKNFNACSTLLYYDLLLRPLNDNVSVSSMFNASCSCLEETPSLIHIEMMQMLTLLDAPASIIAMNEPVAVMGMGKLSPESSWALWKLIRMALRRWFDTVLM